MGWPRRYGMASTAKYRRLETASDQRDAFGRERCRQAIAGQIGIFAFAQRGERIEPHQLVVDMARVAHDHAAVRKPRQKARKELGEIRVRGEIVSACERRIDSDIESPCAGAKPAAQMSDHKAPATMPPRAHRQ